VKNCKAKNFQPFEMKWHNDLLRKCFGSTAYTGTNGTVLPNPLSTLILIMMFKSIH
jgi:hypothetical protein